MNLKKIRITCRTVGIFDHILRVLWGRGAASYLSKSFETGKLADLVVLDNNLFDIDSDEIWKVKPATVLMEGAIIQGAFPEGIQD